MQILYIYQGGKLSLPSFFTAFSGQLVFIETVATVNIKLIFRSSPDVNKAPFFLVKHFFSSHFDLLLKTKALHHNQPPKEYMYML